MGVRRALSRLDHQDSPTYHPLSDFSLHADDFILQQVDAISDAMVVLARLGDVSTEHRRSRDENVQHKFMEVEKWFSCSFAQVKLLTVR